MSAEIVVTPLLDSAVSGDEGSETIIVTLLDGDGYAACGASAEATLLDNVSVTIPDQTMSHTAGSLQIALPSELGGQPASYSARVVDNLAADLNAEHNFCVINENHAYNWGGQQERWLQGDQGYYFILPTGDFSLWQGGFANSQLLGTLDVSFYENPALITTAQATPVQVAISENVLTISPAMTFVGEFDVELTTTVGGASSAQTFNVEVTNAAPQIASLSDVTMPAASTQTVALSLSDLDGDTLSVEVSVASSEAFRLVDEYGLYAEPSISDWGEYESWFFLLPDGSVNRWTGSFENSEQVGTLASSFTKTRRVCSTRLVRASRSRWRTVSWRSPRPTRPAALRSPFL